MANMNHANCNCIDNRDNKDYVEGTEMAYS